MSPDFVHLHTHSSYSPMWGTSTLEALCEAVRTQGHDTFALTDTNGLYGAIRFLEVAKRAGLKPILGTEIIQAQHRAVLLAKSPEGYGNLCRLLSARHEDEPFEFIETIQRYRAGLVILSDDFQALTAWRAQSGEDLYVELTPGADLQKAVSFSRQNCICLLYTSRCV